MVLMIQISGTEIGGGKFGISVTVEVFGVRKGILFLEIVLARGFILTWPMANLLNSWGLHI